MGESSEDDCEELFEQVCINLSRERGEPVGISVLGRINTGIASEAVPDWSPSWRRLSAAAGTAPRSTDQSYNDMIR